MLNRPYQLCAIGNALVDISAQIHDQFLIDHRLTKGSMTLVSTKERAHLYDQLGPTVETSGGSAANTAAGFASFGGHAAYLGRIGQDQFGEIFAHDLKSQSIYFPENHRLSNLPTGTCLVLVTPDAQRTMLTDLGSASLFGEEDLDLTVIQNADVLYLEGYLFDRPEAMKAFYKAAAHAKKSNRQVALTLSDRFCVERHHDAFVQFIRAHVDLLFANQNELFGLSRKETFEEALHWIKDMTPLAVITRSELGAAIITAAEVITHPALPIENVIDTTGAGDLYASGFLFGYTHQYALRECGVLGARAAAEIISHYGTRAQQPLTRFISHTTERRVLKDEQQNAR